jgi:hypothetical protein
VAITYLVDHDLECVVETWTGPNTANDVRVHLDRMLCDPDGLRYLRVISDQRASQHGFTGAEIDDVMRGVTARRAPFPHWTMALVVRPGAQFGSARQFQVYMEGLVETAIFHDLDAARAWLARVPAH